MDFTTLVSLLATSGIMSVLGSFIINKVLDKSFDSIKDKISSIFTTAPGEVREFEACLRGSLKRLCNHYNIKYNDTMMLEPIREYFNESKAANYNIEEMLNRILYRAIPNNRIDNGAKDHWASIFISEVSSLKTDSLFKNIVLRDIYEKNRPRKRVDEREYFIDKWTTPLFLETGEHKLALKDIYEELDCTRSYPEPNDQNESDRNEDTETMSDRLNRFCFTDDPTKALIILGQPGVGKSSLIADFVYHNRENYNFIVLPFKVLKNNSDIFDAVKEYLECDGDYLRGKTLILDGFDEAQLIHNPELDPSTIMKQCLREATRTVGKYTDIKVIVTSRYNYFHIDTKMYDGLLEVYDIEKLTPKSAENILRKVNSKPDLNLIQKIGMKEYEILSFPMVLYMIARTGLVIDKNLDKSTLYRKLFSSSGAIMQTLYSQDRHEITLEYADKLFDITKLIAWEMTTTNKRILPVSRCLELCKEYGDDHSLDSKDLKILQQIFGISCYYKSSYESGNIEFIHYSIENYFSAEMILSYLENNQTYELSRIFSQSKNDEIMYFVGALKADKNCKINLKEWISDEAYRIIHLPKHSDNIVQFIHMWNLAMFLCCELYFVNISRVLLDLIGEYTDFVNFIDSTSFYNCNFNCLDYEKNSSFYTDNYLYNNNVVFKDCSLDCIQFVYGQFNESFFTDCSIQCFKIQNSVFRKSVFTNIDFTCGLLYGITIYNCKFTNCRFKNIEFDNVIIKDSQFDYEDVKDLIKLKGIRFMNLKTKHKSE